MWKRGLYILYTIMLLCPPPVKIYSFESDYYITHCYKIPILVQKIELRIFTLKMKIFLIPFFQKKFKKKFVLLFWTKKSISEQCVVYSVYCHWEYYSSKEKEPIFAKRAAKKKAARKRRPLHLLFFSPDTQVSGRLVWIC